MLFWTETLFFLLINSSPSPLTISTAIFFFPLSNVCLISTLRGRKLKTIQNLIFFWHLERWDNNKFVFHYFLLFNISSETSQYGFFYCEWVAVFYQIWKNSFIDAIDETRQSSYLFAISKKKLKSYAIHRLDLSELIVYCYNRAPNKFFVVTLNNFYSILELWHLTYLK